MIARTPRVDRSGTVNRLVCDRCGDKVGEALAVVVIIHHRTGEPEPHYWCQTCMDDIY